MTISHGGFAELASGLFWGPKERVLMLWAYFDESGEHDKSTGALTYMTLGGCVADCADWRAVEIEWKAVLGGAGIVSFHMADFEARKGAFKDFPEEKRGALLNAFLDIMINRIDRFVGFEISPDNARANSGPWHRFDGTRGAVQALVYYSMSEVEERYRVPDGQKISMVWARHAEVKPSYFDKVLDSLGHEDVRLLRSTSIDDPMATLPLQAADIWAYELSRRGRADHPERYPFKRIREAGKSMRLFSVTGGMPVSASSTP